MSGNDVSLLGRKPWLLVVLAFVLLIAAWVVFLRIAIHNRPAEIPLETAPPVPAGEGKGGAKDGY